jgi:hypothetical protein
MQDNSAIVIYETLVIKHNWQGCLLRNFSAKTDTEIAISEVIKITIFVRFI